MNTYPPNAERWPQNTGPVGEPAPTPPPKKSRAPTVLLVVLLVSMVAIVGCLAMVLARGNLDPKATPAQSPAVTSQHASTRPTATATTKAAPPTPVQFGGGTWTVGSEIKPGTYTTTAKPGDVCYWERLKTFDGEIDSVIANGNIGSGERGRITIKPTDKGVRFEGGCVWSKV